MGSMASEGIDSTKEWNVLVTGFGVRPPAPNPRTIQLRSCAAIPRQSCESILPDC